MDKAFDCITSSCHHSASPCVVLPQPPTPNLKLWVISFTAKVIKWAWQFILTLLNAKRAPWHSPQHTDERVHWHPTTGWPSYCNMNWHWLLFHDPWQWLSSSQAKNCSLYQQSQESKQEPSCRTWTWALSTGFLGWACLPCCTFCCSHNPESHLWIVSLWDVDTAWSVLSSKIPLTDYHLISQIRVKDLLMDQNRWSPQYLGDFVVLVCPLKTQSSQAMDKRDRNRDNCVIKHYLLCFSCTLASRLSLLFSGAVFNVVTYPPFCLNCVPLLLLILLTGVDATDIALYEWQISLNTLFISCPS